MASKGLPTTFTTLVVDMLYECVVDGEIYGGTGMRGLKLSIELCHYAITSTTATEVGNERVKGHHPSFARSLVFGTVVGSLVNVAVRLR